MTSRTTRAVVLDAFGVPDLLAVRSIDLPELQPGQVLLRVRAAAVNPIDIGTRAGRVVPAERARFPMVLGWDVAGEVAATGAGVREWRIDEPVIAMVRQVAAPMGTHAEHVVLDASAVARWPQGVPAPVAAALPLAGLTARSALDALQLRAGEVLLIDGVLGAVGSIAAQLAARAGVLVAGIARPADAEQARRLGVRWILDRDGDPRIAADATIGRPVDAALDVVGGAAAWALLNGVRDGGRYATTLPRWWAPGGPFDPERGITPQVIERKDPTALPALAGLLARGDLRIEIARTLPLEHAAEAYRLVESGSTGGKIVLVPGKAS